MKRSLLAGLILVFLSSCSKYQYVILSSDNTPRSDKNEFVVENDSLRIAYNFYGENGTVYLSLLNKMNRVIQIDWSKTFFIQGGTSSPFLIPQSEIQAELRKGGNYGTSSLNGTITPKQELTFIPPRSSITQSGPSVTPGKVLNFGQNLPIKEKIRISGFSKKIKRAEILRENSPLHFRIYLTIVPQLAGDNSAMVYDQSFYISELIETRAEPVEKYSKQLNRNMIIKHKFTTTGIVLAATGAIVGIALLGAVAGE